MTEHDPQTLSSAFREAFRCHPAGVAVISGAPGGKPASLTVSSLISVSAQPPVVAFSLSTKSTSAAPILASETMVIHLLRQADLPLAQLCATSGVDRFGPGVEWEMLPTGEPRYLGVSTWFRAKRVGALAVEGATLVAAELLEGEALPGADTPETQSLVYLDRRWHRLQEMLEEAS